MLSVKTAESKTAEVVQTVTFKGREFYVLEDKNGFWGIESNKFVDGVLQEKITGLSGLLSKDEDTVTELIKQVILVDDLEAQGMDRFNAVLQVYRERTKVASEEFN